MQQVQAPLSGDSIRSAARSPLGQVLCCLIIIALLVTACGAPASEPSSTNISIQPRATAVVEGQETATKEAIPTNTPAPTQTSVATRTASPTATASSTRTPDATSSPTASPVPSPTATVDTVALDDLQRGYVVMVMLEATTGGLDALAEQVQAGTIDGIEATGSLIALAAVISEVKEIIEADAPTPALSDAWSEAREGLGIVTGVVSDWFDKAITSADVPSTLAPARDHISTAIELAERLMKDEYGVTQEQLTEFRGSTEAEFRAIFQQ